MHLLLFLLIAQVHPAEINPVAIVKVSKNVEVEAYSNGKGYLQIGSGFRNRIAPLDRIIKEQIIIPRYVEDGENILVINRISDYAFFNTTLKSITLPEDIRTLGNYSFAYTHINKIKMSQTNIEEIPYGCFANSTLKYIELPNTLYRVCSYAFDYTQIEIFDPYVNLKYIEPYGLSNCYNLTIANLSQTIITRLDQKAFYECPSLKYMWMSSKITTVLSRTFANTEIDHIKIPKQLTKLETEAFAYSGFHEFDFSECQLTEIPPKAFYSCHKVQKIILSQSTTIIRANAFADCSVSEIGIYSSLETLEEGCFCNTSNLRSLDLSAASVKTIPKDAFRNSNCGNLDLPLSLITISDFAFANGRVAHISVGPKLESIGFNAFQNCLKLFSINLSQTAIKEIKDYTFDNCYSLSSVCFPVSLETIGVRAFYGCNFPELHFPPNIKTVSEYAFASISKLKTADLECMDYKIIEKETFANCTSLEVLKISDIKTIKQGAFRNTKLRTMILQSSINDVYDAAFACCHFLERFDMSKTNIKKIYSDTFANCSRLAEFYFSQETAIIDSSAFYGCALKHFKVPKSLQTLGEFALSHLTFLDRIDLTNTRIEIIKTGCFCYSTKLIDIKLPPISSIEPKAFEGCSNLRIIMLNGTYVKSLPAACFLNCFKLEKIIFPHKLEIIDQQCFAFTNLRKFKPPDTLKTIKKFAFYSSKNLISVSMTTSQIEVIPEGVFLNCTSLTNVSLPIIIKSIGSETFALTNISKFPICQNLNSIGPKCFYGCQNLVHVNLDQSGVSYIPEFCFYNCRKLRKIEFNTYLSEIVFGRFCFSNTGFRTFEFPHVTTEINEGIFSSCVDLVYVDISQVNINLSASIFEGCLHLETLMISTSLQELGSRSLVGTALDKFIAPPSLSRIGSGSFGNCKFLREVDLRNCKVSAIPAECFSLCLSLKIIYFNDHISTIGSCAFMQTKLGKIILPQKTYNIERCLFKDCHSLIEVCLSYTSITIIPYQCFAGCKHLKKVLLPESINTIGIESFASTKIKSINLPKTTNIIGSSCFMFCESLKKIDLSRTNIEVLPPYLFYNCTSLVEVSLPILLVELDQTCFIGCSSLKVFEYCGYGDHQTSKLPSFVNDEMEVHVKKDFKHKKFFGLQVIKGYYCGTAPDPTPRPTDKFWVMPEEKIEKRSFATFALLSMCIAIVITYATAFYYIASENRRDGYSLLQ